MRKTFCDRCGTECVNSVCHVNMTVTHSTSDQQPVGEDDYSSVELCNDCGETIRAMVPFRLRHSHEYGGPVSEDEPVPVRRAIDEARAVR